MKKRRHIEITAFRRRTTIILRDKPKGGAIEPPPRHVDAPHPAPADAPLTEGDELNPPSHAASAGRLEIPEGRNETPRKKQVGRLS